MPISADSQHWPRVKRKSSWIEREIGAQSFQSQVMSLPNATSKTVPVEHCCRSKASKYFYWLEAGSMSPYPNPEKNLGENWTTEMASAALKLRDHRQSAMFSKTPFMQIASQAEPTEAHVSVFADVLTFSRNQKPRHHTVHPCHCVNTVGVVFN